MIYNNQARKPSAFKQMIPQAAGTPLSFLFGSLSSNTLRIITYIGYALILLGLIVGVVGSLLWK